MDFFYLQCLMALVILLNFFHSYSYSVAIAVDNPELFNRIAETFRSKAVFNFAILLWGDKSCLAVNEIDGIPVFTYKEIIDMGRESRRVLFDSNYACKLVSCVNISILYIF